MPPKKKDDKKDEEVVAKDEVGTYCYPDGSKYDGQITRKGDGAPASSIIKRNGNGVFVDTTATYDGQWLDDEMSGDGTLSFESGASYVGGFLFSAFEGKGKYTFPDGSYYDGQWRRNNMHGEGVYVDATGKRWVGKFYDGQGLDLRLEIA